MQRMLHRGGEAKRLDRAAIGAELKAHLRRLLERGCFSRATALRLRELNGCDARVLAGLVVLGLVKLHPCSASQAGDIAITDDAFWLTERGREMAERLPLELPL